MNISKICIAAASLAGLALAPAAVYSATVTVIGEAAPDVIAVPTVPTAPPRVPPIRPPRVPPSR